MFQIVLIAQLFSKRSHMTDILLVGGVALVTASLLMGYIKRRKKAAVRPTPHEQIDRMKQQRGMRGDLENLMVEIEQLSRRFGAQLDAKSIRLERLLGEADRRIEKFQELIREPQAAHSPQKGDPLAPPPQGASDPQHAGGGGRVLADPLAKSVYALSDQGLEPADIAQRLGELVGKIELILALRNA